jgi:hypothetical protein
MIPENADGGIPWAVRMIGEEMMPEMEKAVSFGTALTFPCRILYNIIPLHLSGHEGTPVKE